MTDERPSNPADVWSAPKDGSYTKVKYLQLEDEKSADVRILATEPKTIWKCNISINGVRYPATISREDSAVVDKFNEGKETDDKTRVRKSRRHIVNVLDRRDGLVKIWEMADETLDQIGPIVDKWKKLPTEFDVTVTRRGVKLKTKYVVGIAPNQEKLTTEELALEKVDLDEYFKPNRERLESLLRGEVPKRREDTNGKKTETAATVPTEQPNPLEKGETVV